MSGVIPPLPQYAFVAWCLVKHTDNFTFTLTFLSLSNAAISSGFQVFSQLFGGIKWVLIFERTPCMSSWKVMRDPKMCLQKVRTCYISTQLNKNKNYTY
jgi:hypothetical protein